MSRFSKLSDLMGHLPQATPTQFGRVLYQADLKLSDLIHQKQDKPTQLRPLLAEHVKNSDLKRYSTLVGGINMSALVVDPFGAKADISGTLGLRVKSSKGIGFLAQGHMMTEGAIVYQPKRRYEG